MSPQRIALIFCVLILVAWASWMFRYDLHDRPTILLDRWTGATYRLHQGKWIKIETRASFDLKSAVPVEDHKPAVKWEDFTPAK